MLEPKAPPARNGSNTGSLAPGVRRRVNKKKLNLNGIKRCNFFQIFDSERRASKAKNWHKKCFSCVKCHNVLDTNHYAFDGSG